MKYRPKPERIPSPGKISDGRAVDVEVPAATLIPDSWVPQRKWFAGLIGAIVLNAAAALGLDLGALLEPLIDPFVDVSEETVETTARSVVGWAAGQYLWPEWRSLPATVRKAGRKILKKVRDAFKLER